VYLFEIISKVDINDKEMISSIMPWAKEIPQELRASKHKE
jgi:hypothetical protein